FGGSAAIGAVAGILITPITLTSYDVGTMLALKGFAAAMLGGMGNPLGAVAGGLLLGLLEAFGVGYISSTYKDAFAFIVILLVL
ncbi:ABC transporter permease subunit, partial [Klebsiella pneumoniae]